MDILLFSAFINQYQSASIYYSWFTINPSGYGGQCQPPTPAESDNGINNIFLCVVPPTWPP